MRDINIPDDAIRAIKECLERGSDAEVKWVGNNIKVVEIRRKLKIKSAVIGLSEANRGE